ncbi:MAG TPA: hypothetical protein PK413_18190, partial [Thermoanaerobaculia bacterium]|nr:hypothetical protein [Thermoanaerobaculia bacterium]
METLPQPLRSRVRIGARSQLAAGSRPADPQTVLPTAQPALDTLLCGGLPRGALCELDGRFSSGRFSLVLAVLAAATGVGEAAALIDLGDSLDPRAAATAGVDLKRLLWVRPRRTQEALMAAEAVLGSGFPCVVVDLGLPPLAGGKGQEGHWLRLARAARDQEASVLVSSPYRLTGPAATVVLAAERAQARWCGPQPWL